MSEETLTLKDMQGHVVKTIVGSAITSLLIVIVAGVTFYYGTNAAIARLNEKQSDMNKTLDSHTEQINKTNTGMGMSTVQQQAFEKRLTGIEESQKQILNVLIEIKNNN
jgi:uncharacterized protein HemX